MTPAAQPDDRPALQLEDVTMTFPGVVALDRVQLAIPRGHVTGLVGQNGAGKSTLTKILAGIIPTGAHGGHIMVDGRPMRFRTPRDAVAAGVVLIPQELSLHEQLSVAENVLLGEWPTRGGRIDWPALRTRAASILDRVGLTTAPDTPVAHLSPSEQQLVAIARGLVRDPRVLLLDEPTAALDGGEVRRLLEVIGNLRRDGVTVIYVSHRLEEVLAVCDRVVVLRDGRVAQDAPAATLTRQALIERIVGTVDAAPVPAGTRQPPAAGLVLTAALSVPDPRRPGRQIVRDARIELRAGEVVGLVGLVGSGRTELLWALYGALPRHGEVRVDGRPLPAGPAHAVAAGIGLLTEERRATGLFPLWSLAENVTAAALDRLSRAGWMPRRAEATATRAVVDRLGIKTAGPRAPVATLSGGNQQKALLGRWLVRGARVLLLDEPARGVDVGAKSELYRQFRQLAERSGLAILTTSSDVGELVSVCDRFLILRDGTISAEVPGAAASEPLLLDLAGGGKPE